MPLPEPLGRLLRATSRSFALSLAIVPSPCRAAVALAYLLARAADTIADAPGIDAREPLLAAFPAACRGQGRAALIAAAAAASPGVAGAEGELLRELPAALALLDGLPADDRQRIVALLEVIAAGMGDDLRRFPAGAPLRALPDRAALDDYTYAVAGVVGRFWSETLAGHVRRLRHLARAPWVEDGVAFGRALQRVNIVRDLPADLAAGRCYLPATELAAAGLEPAALADPASWPALAPVVAAQIRQARAELRRGARYLRAVPACQLGAQLAARWPLELAHATLDRLERADLLAGPCVKVPRRQLYWLLAGSLPRALLA